MLKKVFIIEGKNGINDDKMHKYVKEILKSEGIGFIEAEASIYGLKSDTDDELYEKIKKFAFKNGQVSVAKVQRAFQIGYSRAARMIDELEEDGIIGPPNGILPRKLTKKYRNRKNRQRPKK
ncbi:MAG: DNA translocase FtsK [Patescibacteria group bacterium]|nr:DNA translocase FtsK [Patescibacteria group bacterium]